MRYRDINQALIELAGNEKKLGGTWVIETIHEADGLFYQPVRKPAGLTILVQARKAYGQVRFYPMNDKAKDMASLTHTETFTFTMLMTIKRMGATLELTADSYRPPEGAVEYLQYVQLGIPTIGDPKEG